MRNINSTAKLNLKNNILIPKFRDLMKQTHWPIYAVEEKIKSDKADQHPPVNTAGSPPVLPYLARVLLYKPADS